MIAQLTKGKGFRGLVEYLAQTAEGERRGQLLATNMAGSTPREWAQEFGLVRRLRPTLGKAVFHASLSPSPDDPPLTDEDYGRIARHFMSGMGFPEDAPHVVIRHDDQSHPHIHIAASRVTPSGDVVSDARDFQRAEALVRDIEAAHGLRAVAPSKPQKKKRRQRREQAMNDEAKREAQPEPAEIPQEDMSAEVAEPWNAEQRREARRQLLDDEYRDMLQRLFGNDVASIRRNRKRPSMQIRFKDGASLHDEGDRLRIDDKDDQSAARRLVAAAVAKGWTAVSVRGNPQFVKEAMRQAMANGIQVLPLDAAQAEMLDEVMRERSSMGGAASPRPAPAPAPAPVQMPKTAPPIDMNKLAAMRQSNANRRAGPKMRRR